MPDGPSVTLPGRRLVTLAGDVAVGRAGSETLVYVMGWAGLVAFALLFPRPWAPLTRRRWLLPVACVAPVALVVALALVALGGVGLPQWVGRVIAGETVVSLTMLGLGIALAMVRYLTATDTIGRQQLKWLAGGACVSGTLALAVWFLPSCCSASPRCRIPGWASPACPCWPASPSPSCATGCSTWTGSSAAPSPTGR